MISEGPIGELVVVVVEVILLVTNVCAEDCIDTWLNVEMFLSSNPALANVTGAPPAIPEFSSSMCTVDSSEAVLSTS